MDIETALKTTDTRLTFGNHRWLVWDDFMKWNVYERLPYAKTTTLIESTFYIADAVKALVKEDQNCIIQLVSERNVIKVK